MTDKEFEALQILAMGPARRAPFTRSDVSKGIHAINGNAARYLINCGYARAMTHWPGCVEITDMGRAQLSPTLT